LVDWHHSPQNDLHPNDLSRRYYPPRHAVKIVQRFVRKRVPPQTPSYVSIPRILYVSREDATVRKLKPNDERRIITTLMDIVGPANVDWYLAKGKSVIHQIRSFENVDIIIGPHGAGLTNMIWATPSPTSAPIQTPIISAINYTLTDKNKRVAVVMFPMKPYNDNCFGAEAMALDLDFWVIPNIHSYYYGVYPTVSDEAIEVLKETVKTILEGKGWDLPLSRE